MELISYEDFKQHESKSVYAVIYSSILNNGILPLAEELSSKEIDNLTDIFNDDIEDQILKYSVPYGNNRSIHIFSTVEECNDYITKCKEIIIHNLLSYYKIKISQYTTTVNKIESKMDDFLS